MVWLLILVTFPLMFLGRVELKNIPKVLLISLDGFRWDYMERLRPSEIPNLWGIREQGVYARKGIKSVFVTKTFTNHFSIVTGLYAESHGIINNFMYDPLFNETFDISNAVQETESKWFDNGAEPLWVTNQKNGNWRRSGIAFWPCSTAPIKNRLPSTFLMYDNFLPERAKINTLVSWFADAAPINLGLLYFNEPDRTGHSFGPDSPRIKQKIEELDKLLGYLFNRLEDAGVLDDLNIVVTSDHGMVSIPKSKQIYLSDYTNLNLFRIVGGIVVTYIIPQEGQLDTVYKSLKKIPNCETYKREEIPLRYHYSNNRRITPIIVVGHEGYTIFPTRNDSTELLGDHGYDNELPNMHAFFLARGPAFKRNFSIETFNNIDIYPLLCHILGITPVPNNGSYTNVQSLLSVGMKWKDSSSLIYLLVIPLCLFMCSVICGAACCLLCSIHRTKLNFYNSHNSNNFTKLANKDELFSDSDEKITRYT